VNIWLDLANSPQVLFFRPLIPEMERWGHSVTVTTRNFAQTTELADHFGFDHTPVGSHGGKKISQIGLAILERAYQLKKFADRKKFDIAISHNSYSQAIAAKILGIPFTTSMDYEHQPANHLCFRLARRVVVPEFFPDDALKRFGAAKKTVRYHGTKEEVYLSNFKPVSDPLASLCFISNQIVVVMRPPGTWGLYHHFENPLFDMALHYVAASPNTHVILLPRVAFQADTVKNSGYSNIFVPPVAIDGPNLMYHADLVISGGGSMNREAAVLGTPTYSLFKGKLSAVDRYLVDKGKMCHIDSEEGISSIPIRKKESLNKTQNNTELIKELAQLMIQI
jgi:predicted glycosyltransferase